jgi:hypothetical protein
VPIDHGDVNLFEKVEYARQCGRRAGPTARSAQYSIAVGPINSKYMLRAEIKASFGVH